MELYEKTLSVQPIYDGRIIHAHVDDVELGNGAVTKREVVDHPGGVSVAVLTEKNELIFVRQFRYPYRKVLLELPAGKLETGEDPFEAMKREQLEETGTKGESYVSLGEVYPTPGYCGEIIRLWACRRTERQQELHLDEDEFLDIELIPLDKAVEMVLSNEIPDAKTQIGVLKTAFLVKNRLI
ncbi:NUDIX hydrolase [Acutalibacter muris]|uniref:NUDIX hydrolase n=1 Tax=Acutalibacter muris TaxID=1796620 RepID=UPI001C3E95B7|nr:NUDIX hydrolase [Acutalibacter muris]